MKHLLFSFLIILFFTACSVKQDISIYNNTNIKKLSFLITNSSVYIDENEANKISEEAISHSSFLAKKYGVNTTALFHNTLVNLELKDRGFCYHYARDLIKLLNPKDYKSFEIRKIVANRGEYFEHTALLITRHDVEFKNSIVLDAWRNTGDLYFSKVINDKKYKWELK